MHTGDAIAHARAPVRVSVSDVWAQKIQTT